jgi:hypothetical protein
VCREVPSQSGILVAQIKPLIARRVQNPHPIAKHPHVDYSGTGPGARPGVSFGEQAFLMGFETCLAFEKSEDTSDMLVFGRRPFGYRLPGSKVSYWI